MPRREANWILGELARELNNSGFSISESKVSAENLAGLIRFIDDGKISGKQAKDVLVEMFAEGKTAAEVVREKGLEQISDPAEIERLVEQVITENASQVEAYRAGNKKLLGFFVGQIMQASGGRANPKVVNQILANRL